MRIDKYISRALNITRNDARQIIKKELVKVNKKIVTKNDYFIKEYVDVVSYMDKDILYKEFVYIMLYKEAGFVSANKDNLHKTVIDELNGNYDNYDLALVGRLDLDTEGLMLLTNDGALAHRLISPKYKVPKKYYVECDKDFSPSDINTFEEGFTLLDGDGKEYMTRQAKLEIIDSNKAYVTIHEGKYHQIKKMCRYVGKEVTYLKRLSIGNIILDGALKKGEFRELTIEEIDILRNAVK